MARMGGGAFAVLTQGEDSRRRPAGLALPVRRRPADPDDRRDHRTDLRLSGSSPWTTGVTRRGAARPRRPCRPGRARGGPRVRAARYSAALGDAAARRTGCGRRCRAPGPRAELFLLFQPIVSVEQQRITGIEAQLRWKHPELGEIPPTEFLPLAERAGLIGELVRWALEETRPGGRRSARGATSPLRIGLKVPAGYVATGTLVTDVEHALRRSGPRARAAGAAGQGVDRERRTTTASGSTSARLRLMGVHVALDGFGSGTSALAHLTRLPIDIVRLDRTADQPHRPRPAEPRAVRVDHRHRPGARASTSSPTASRRRRSWPHCAASAATTRRAS